MGFSSRCFRILRPETFLYVMSLETGASLIILSLLLNKISGLYGLLALLTGYHLSPLQLSMYLYSLLTLGLVAFLFPHIRKQSPLQCLALAWLYTLDSVINAVYTAAFGVTWFTVVSQHYANTEESARYIIPKRSFYTEVTTGDRTSFSYVGGNTYYQKSSNGFSNIVSQPEGFQCVVFISLLWIIRVYFILVMLSFARQTVRLYVTVARHTQLPTHSRCVSINSVSDIDREPFSPWSLDGQGWRGKLGRAMIGLNRGYFLGEEEEINWTSQMGRRFRNCDDHIETLELPGPLERERRRRSGTGPPQPPRTIIQAATLQQPVYDQDRSTSVKMQEWVDER